MASDAIMGVVSVGAGLSAIASAVVTWRAFGHTSKKDEATETREDARNEATTTAIVAELRSALERAFVGIRENSERFRNHDLDCARDKAKTAADLRYVAETMQLITGRLETLNRQMVFLARDQAEDRTAHRLGQGG